MTGTRAVVWAAVVTCALVTSVTADEWPLPTARSYYSVNRQFRVEVIPRPVASPLAFFADKVAGKEPAGSAAGTEGRRLATFPLLNGFSTSSIGWASHREIDESRHHLVLTLGPQGEWPGARPRTVRLRIDLETGARLTPLRDQFRVPGVTRRVSEGIEAKGPSQPGRCVSGDSFEEVEALRSVTLSSERLLSDLSGQPVPVYPPILQTARFGGVVTLELLLSPDGRVRCARTWGPPLLAPGALETALSWSVPPFELTASTGRGRVALEYGLLEPAEAGERFTAGKTSSGIYYEMSGSGEPVVLIHAFSVDRRMWAPQIVELEKRFRVIRYDQRGHGNSVAPVEPYSAHGDLRSVLDALGVGRATLVGLSAGSTLAIDFALAYPDRVTRLVLASPGLNGYVPSTPLTWTQPVFQAAGSGDAEGAAKLWAETPIMTVYSGGAAAASVKANVMDNVRLWTFRTNPVQPLMPPAITRLGEIKAPTLVIRGERDLPHIKEVADLLLKGIGGARLATVPGAGHIVNLDAPGAFNAAVDAFLAGP